MSSVKLVKNKKKDSTLKKTCVLFQDFLDVIISLFIVIIIVGMPFYNKNGYGSIGTDKYNYFKNSCIGIGTILIPLAGVCLLLHIIWLKKDEGASLTERFKALLKGFTVTDICALVYGIAAILSYVSSDYKSEALWGTSSWYMGLFTQLAFVVIYFMISRFWKARLWVPALIIPVSAAVFVIGYLNRFGITPVDLGDAGHNFISTIGNINWYCGYLVTVLFGILYLVLNSELEKVWIRRCLYGYVGIGFATLITQGSNSGFLAFIGVMYLLFLLSAGHEKRQQQFWNIILILGMVCLITTLIRLLFPEAFVLQGEYADFATDLLTTGFVPVLITLAAAGIRFWLYRCSQKGTYPKRFFKITALVIGITAAVLAVVIVILIVVNTIWPGSIGPLSGISVFNFSLEWGSNRGTTWRAGILCFLEQGFWKKLVGVGPDCLAVYLYNDGSREILAMVNERFSNLRLTNAHNEWLNLLVNVGLLGMVSYAVMLVSAAVRYIKAGIRSNSIKVSIIGACGFSILAYCINNMVSFQQAMGSTILFVIMGMGGAFIRERNLSESENIREVKGNNRGRSRNSERPQ